MTFQKLDDYCELHFEFGFSEEAYQIHASKISYLSMFGAKILEKDPGGVTFVLFKLRVPVDIRISNISILSAHLDVCNLLQEYLYYRSVSNSTKFEKITHAINSAIDDMFFVSNIFNEFTNNPLGVST